MGRDAPPDPPAEKSVILHASCVSVEGRALLIRGASGRGKSALALQMIALGARLVADDRVVLSIEAGQIRAAAPAAIAGLIEARGLGLLRAPAAPAEVAYVLDLDQPETARLPDPLETTLLGQPVPLLRAPPAPIDAAALMQLLRAGRVAPEWPNS
ncbi:Hpr(Ser) kinase/phosphatase [Cribrihabitans marinus]|uniref:Hpr(Ser) kinase/phosphatase n=1 Tax=Cribrihabitans marinus TaxID=1227549 RepID=A0A1H7CFQ3_9RHOB|nr:serine kinase [Cribrihabitans marinus]GGH35403.1 aldolase [Cribrihabitans marinus]SEJ88529.1 Hpr(Ser) kinase/phosphatase [Cribrihabitans marinus]